MRREPPLPKEVWEQIPPAVQAVRWGTDRELGAPYCGTGGRGCGTEGASPPEFAELLAPALDGWTPGQAHTAAGPVGAQAGGPAGAAAPRAHRGTAGTGERGDPR